MCVAFMYLGSYYLTSKECSSASHQQLTKHEIKSVCFITYGSGSISNLSTTILFPDDMNWNALEWDRAAEELTWERVRFFLSCILVF